MSKKERSLPPLFQFIYGVVKSIQYGKIPLSAGEGGCGGTKIDALVYG